MKLCELPSCGKPVKDSRCRFCSSACSAQRFIRAIPPCGTNAKYVRQHCRCVLCRAARLAYVHASPAAMARQAKVHAREIEIIAEVRAARALGAVRDSKESSKAQRASMRMTVSQYDDWKWNTRFAKLVDPDYYRGLRQPLQQSALSEFA